MPLTTLLSRSSSSILQHLSKVTPDPNNIILFTVSANATNLEAIISRLRLLARHSIGCLSVPLPGDPEAVVCATATFSAQVCVPFRSAIRGRAPVQVGRWKPRRVAFENTDDSELPDFTQRPSIWKDIDASSKGSQLPTELLGQRGINSVLFFSDDAPEGLIRSLGQVPQAKKLGLIASSTPFITGRPFTLFYDQQIFSSGAVGVALKQSIQPISTTAFHGLVPLSTPIKVSKSEGNLIHQLNQSNPAKMLIEAIAADSRMSQSKDEDFFLGHLCPTGQEVRRVYRILSGGPSRGSIALDSDSAPAEGEMVQFFSQTPHSPLAAIHSLKLHIGHTPSVQFLCAADAGMASSEPNASDGDQVQVFHDTFLVASENGFLCTEGLSSRPMWKCAVQGAVGSMTWKDNKSSGPSE